MGLIGAFLAAIAYGIATIAQAIGVRSASAASGGLLHKAIAGWLFGLGLAFDGLGYVASFAALRELPLFLVESAIASSVAVTAVLAVVVLKQKLRRLETAALGAVVFGLILLSLSAEPGSADMVSGWVGWLILGAAMACVVALLLGRSSLKSAIVAGCGFALVGLASRLLEIPAHHAWKVMQEPMAWGLGIGGVVAVVAYGMALESGRATTVAAVTFAVETVVPSLIGLLLLGDQIRPGHVVVAALGFGATLAGCVALSARAEVSIPDEAGAAL